MKRIKMIFVLSLICVAFVSCYGGFGAYEGTALLAILGAIVSIAMIVCFFQLVRDVREIRDHFIPRRYKEKSIKENLYNDLITGKIDVVREHFLEEFKYNIDRDYNKNHNLNESIRPYIDELKKRFDIIGESIPEYIDRMQTFDDFYNILNVKMHTNENSTEEQSNCDENEKRDSFKQMVYMR